MSNENNNSRTGSMWASASTSYMNTLIMDRMHAKSAVTSRARKRLPTVQDGLFPIERPVISKLITEERHRRGLGMPPVNPTGVNDEEETYDQIVIQGFTLPQGIEHYLQNRNMHREVFVEMVGIHKGLNTEGFILQGDHYILHNISKLIPKLTDFGFVRLSCDTDWITILDHKNLPVAMMETAVSKQKNLSDDEVQLDRFKLFTYDDELSKRLRDVLSEHIKIKDMETNAVGVIDIITDVTQLGLEKRTVTVNQGDRQTYPSFYPWMNGMSVVEYIQEFLESKEKILYLYGLPGTGKSSMLMSAISELGLRALMTSNAKITSNPSFVSKLCEKMGGIEGQYDLVIVEDADAMMRPRDGEGGNLALNELLSATDGISSTQFKLVVTSNKEDTEGVDPALLRHSRAFDIMKFGRLTPAEAAVVRECMKLPPVNFTSDVTLAQVMAGASQPSMRSAEDEKVSIVGHRFPLNEAQRGIKVESSI